MPYIIAAVVVLFAFSTTNLLFTLAVIRRLRVHTDLLSSMAGGGPGIIASGESLDSLSTIDVDGRPVRLDSTEGAMLVGFFSPGCQSCKEWLPDFLGYAGVFAAGGRPVLGVVTGEAAESSDLATRIGAVARVVIEAPGGPLAAAFQVGAYPSWAIVDGGLVRESGVGLDRLPSLASA